MTDNTFANNVRKRFPEGLTGLFAIGGTRTTYILEKNRHATDPGQINDFEDYGETLLNKYLDFSRMYVELGGQNLIISVFSFIGFYNRGGQYAEFATRELGRLTNEVSSSFYRQNRMDPYFVGIDTMLRLPQDSSAHRMARHLAEFQKDWSYDTNHHKLIWEIAAIPNLSLWSAFQRMTEDERHKITEELESYDNLLDVQRSLYHHFSKAVFGFEIPMPHFYLGTNKGGDLKLRSPLGIGLTAGEYLRLYYTPYPSLFITRETLKAIIEDLAFNERFHSTNTDYKGQYTPELAQKEYDRIMALCANPNSVLGFTRRVSE